MKKYSSLLVGASAVSCKLIVCPKGSVSSLNLFLPLLVERYLPMVPVTGSAVVHSGWFSIIVDCSPMIALLLSMSAKVLRPLENEEKLANT